MRLANAPAQHGWGRNTKPNRKRLQLRYAITARPRAISTAGRRFARTHAPRLLGPRANPLA